MRVLATDGRELCGLVELQADQTYRFGGPSIREAPHSGGIIHFVHAYLGRTLADVEGGGEYEYDRGRDALGFSYIYA